MDQDVRQQITFDQFMRLERLAQWGTGRETKLQRLYARWSDARSYRAPAVDQFSRDWIVDARADNPQHFILPNHTGYYAKSWNSRYLGDFPVTAHAARCGVEYLAARESGEPTCHYLNQRIDGIIREYVRLVLPLADGHLLYGTRILRLRTPPAPAGFA